MHDHQHRHRAEAHARQEGRQHLGRTAVPTDWIHRVKPARSPARAARLPSVGAVVLTGQFRLSSPRSVTAPPGPASGAVVEDGLLDAAVGEKHVHDHQRRQPGHPHLGQVVDADARALKVPADWTVTALRRPGPAARVRQRRPDLTRRRQPVVLAGSRPDRVNRPHLGPGLRGGVAGSRSGSPCTDRRLHITNQAVAPTLTLARSLTTATARARC